METENKSEATMGRRVEGRARVRRGKLRFPGVIELGEKKKEKRAFYCM